MTHEERLLASEVDFPSKRYAETEDYCDEHIRIHEFLLARYSDYCETFCNA